MTHDRGRRMPLSEIILLAHGIEAISFSEMVRGFYEVGVEIAYLHPMPAFTPGLNIVRRGRTPDAGDLINPVDPGATV